MCALLNLSEDTQWSTDAGQFRPAEESGDEFSDADEAHLPEMAMMPELDMLSLPSSLAPGEIDRNALESIAMVEAELRRGQIHDALHELRLALGEKSLCFRAAINCQCPKSASNQQTPHVTRRASTLKNKFSAEFSEHVDIVLPNDCGSITRNSFDTLAVIVSQRFVVSGVATEIAIIRKPICSGSR